MVTENANMHEYSSAAINLWFSQLTVYLSNTSLLIVKSVYKSLNYCSACYILIKGAPVHEVCVQGLGWVGVRSLIPAYGEAVFVIRSCDTQERNGATLLLHQGSPLPYILDGIVK